MQLLFPQPPRELWPDYSVDVFIVGPAESSMFVRGGKANKAREEDGLKKGKNIKTVKKVKK